MKAKTSPITKRNHQVYYLLSMVEIYHISVLFKLVPKFFLSPGFNLWYKVKVLIIDWGYWRIRIEIPFTRTKYYKDKDK